MGMKRTAMYLTLCVVAMVHAFSKNGNGQERPKMHSPMRPLQARHRRHDPVRSSSSSTAAAASTPTGQLAELVSLVDARDGGLRVKGGVGKQQGANVKAAGSLRFLTGLLDSYTNLLIAHPYPTKMISSAIVGGLGDVLIQSYEARKTKKPIDLRRLLVFSSVCSLYMAPVINVWFNFLASLPFLASMSNLKKALWQIFIDQTVGATLITVGFFFAFEMVSVVCVLARLWEKSVGRKALS
jgi:hypothetical protein